MKTLRITFLLFLLVISCDTRTATPETPAPTPVRQATTQSSPTDSASSEVRSAILTAMQAMMKQSHRARSSVTLTESGQTQEKIVEYSPPDRYHITVGTYELAVIGELVFLKIDQSWEPTKQLTSAQVTEPDQLDYMAATIKNYLLEGEESLNGQVMQVYTYRSARQAGELWLENQTRLWVGKADGLPYLLVIDGDIQGVDPSTGKEIKVAGTTRITVEYDPTIQIEIVYK